MYPVRVARNMPFESFNQGLGFGGGDDRLRGDWRFSGDHIANIRRALLRSGLLQRRQDILNGIGFAL